MASESESEKRETSADVADEIRRAVESMGDEIPYTVSAGTMRRVAERIEAAWKRQEKTYLDQIRDAMNMWGHEKHIAEHAQKPTVGNAAAMREALEAISRINTGGLKRLLVELVEADIFDGGLINKTISAVEKAKRALSAPARNCDKYDNFNDALRQFVKERPDTKKIDEQGRSVATAETYCVFANWLLTPAVERKGEVA